jgi:hypothetical protein
MISDTLCEALAEIRRYRSDETFRECYCDPDSAARLDALEAHMEEALSFFNDPFSSGTGSFGPKHYVTVIETGAPDIYFGPRIAVFHSRKEAEEDVREFLEECEEFMTPGPVAETMKLYEEAFNRICKIEEPDGP